MPTPDRRPVPWLRAHRRRYGLTLAEVAHKAEISVSALSRYETGSRRPDSATIIRISDAIEALVRNKK